MAESLSISRKKPKDSPYSFASLRKEGLKLVQDLSGDIWTDYNVHDPGVTILEQLCYALTDLIYRTDFPMEDHLTGEDGHIDFPYQALYPPEQIFPCRPTTTIDYRKAILDAVPEIENVRLKLATAGPHDGLYHMTVRQKQHGGQRRPDDIMTSITNVYRSNRNLCEDLHDITILDEVDCELEASLDVRGSRDPDDIVAEIYYRCAQHMAGGTQFSPFDDSLREGQTLEEIFTGPSTAHGLMKDKGLDASCDQDLNALTSDLFSLITTIEGVERIDRFAVRPRQEQDHTQPYALRLAIPEQQDAMHVRISKNGRAIPISIDHVRATYDKLDFAYQSQRYTLHDLPARARPPQGTFRNLQQYYSLQNQFPFMYGINAYGVPTSATEEVKAKTIQLKTYLLLFEQIMANYTANLHHAQILFSGDPNAKHSYVVHPLDNTTIPNIEQVYTQSPPSRLVDRIVRDTYDASKYPERKNRVLDYLLALYGEKFSQASLRHFNYCDTPNEVEQLIVHNKLTFLRHVVDLGQNRAGAFDYGKPSWNTTNTSGLKKRVSILLGLKYTHERSLTNVFTEEGLKLSSDEDFQHVREGTVGLDFIDLDDIDARTNERFHTVPRTPSPDAATHIATHALLKEIIFLKQNLLGESILRGGITRDRYRIGSAGGDADFQIALRPEGDTRWYYLASYPTRNEAILAANAFRSFIISLNIESEGLHVIEHLLLRPSRQHAHDISVPEHFFSFRMSVIFPAWTTRFHNAEFRKLAEETVRLNCPAHIYAEFYWLDFERMHAFEALYLKWTKHKAATPAGSPEVDVAATGVIEFLLEHKHPVGPDTQKSNHA